MKDDILESFMDEQQGDKEEDDETDKVSFVPKSFYMLRKYIKMDGVAIWLRLCTPAYHQVPVEMCNFFKTMHSLQDVTSKTKYSTELLK